MFLSFAELALLVFEFCGSGLPFRSPGGRD
jgi:hypothetical protein